VVVAEPVVLVAVLSAVEVVAAQVAQQLVVLQNLRRLQIGPQKPLPRPRHLTRRLHGELRWRIRGKMPHKQRSASSLTRKVENEKRSERPEIWTLEMYRPLENKAGQSTIRGTR